MRFQFTPDVPTKTPTAPDGKRAYVIGDVHGCLDLLELMLQAIEKDRVEKSTKETFIIFLGDLIDRGPDSRGVIERLMAGPPQGASFHFIKGNHEEALVQGLFGEPSVLHHWLKHGGSSTAASYGIEVDSLIGRNFIELETILKAAIPEAHLEFMSAFTDSIVFGDYFLVHAGVRPGRELRDQKPEDLYWIRRPFHDNSELYDKIIVHGHTIVETIEVHANRIALDTGAYKRGILSGICLDADQIEPISVRLK